MKTTEKERLESIAVEQKLDELRKVVMDCETITSVYIRIDEYGYDQHINRRVPLSRRYKYPYRVNDVPVEE